MLDPIGSWPTAARLPPRSAGARRVPPPTTSPCCGWSVTSRRGGGQLGSVTTIQRLNTKGGVASGSCEQLGAFLSVPYAADYAFYRKND
jgi:hypothetical protein